MSSALKDIMGKVVQSNVLERKVVLDTVAAHILLEGVFASEDGVDPHAPKKLKQKIAKTELELASDA